ncbi:MAG: protein kinase [Bacteroidota bacterium]
MENLIGKLIDNYRIVSILGKGGMGIVYKAYDTKLDRYVAIKMLNAQSYDRERFVERFKREAKNQAKLSHPNIVTVYGFIEYGDMLGIAMEYVEGESLEKVIQRQGRFNLYDIIYILKQALLGLGYAHSKGFVHRDIKPSNIILNKEGITKIMDFGISKSLFDKNMTKTGSKIGTVYYMSPEQIKGEDVTNRSDIYSLGCTLFEMIVGIPPFDYQSEYEVMDSHLKKTPAKISSKLTGIPELVDKIVSRSLEKNPMERYNTCEEMYNEVQELDKDVAKLYTSYFKKTQERSKSYKAFSGLAFAGIIVLMIVLAYFVYTQVNELLTSNKLDQLKKYSIQSLFSTEQDKNKFTSINKVQSSTLSNLNSIFFASDKFAAAVGDSGTIMVSSNSGLDWQPKNFNRKINLSDVYCSSSGKAIIVGDSSSIYFSNNFLDSLQQIPFQQGFTFFRVKFIDNESGFITGNKGLILKTINGGINWYKVATNTTELIFDLAFIDSKRGYAVGWNGIILKTSNGGESWTKSESSGNDNYFKSVDFTSNGYGLIVGGDGTILRSTNYGEHWEEIKITDIGGLQRVLFISESNAVLISNRGAIMVSKDKGETWKLVDSQIFSNMNDLAINPEGNLYMVGVNGMMFRIE